MESIDWVDIFKHIVDWPVLGFILVSFAFFYFRDAIRKAISKGGITVRWGENTVTIGEAVEGIDKELKQNLDDFRIAMKELQELKAELEARVPGTLQHQDLKDPAWFKIREALEDSRYRWRTCERLGIIAGLTEEQTLEKLAEHGDEVVLGKNEAGDRIARLKDR